MSSATIGEVVRSGRARYIVEEPEGGCTCATATAVRPFFTGGLAPGRRGRDDPATSTWATLP